MTFTDDEIREYIEEDLLPSIEAGTYDAHLRAIVRACFARRKVVKGDALVVDDEVSQRMYAIITKEGVSALSNGLSSLEAPIEEETTTVEAPVDTNTPCTENLPSGGIAPRQIQLGTLQPAPKFRRYNETEVVKWNGKRYLRSDLIGAEFVFPTNMRPKGLGGVRARIMGVGDKSFKLLLLTPPSTRLDRMYKDWQSNAPVFIARNGIFNLLVDKSSTTTKKES